MKERQERKGKGEGACVLGGCPFCWSISVIIRHSLVLFYLINLVVCPIHSNKPTEREIESTVECRKKWFKMFATKRQY